MNEVMEFVFEHRASRRKMVAYGRGPDYGLDAWRQLSAVTGHVSDWDECERPEFWQDGDQVIDERTLDVYDARDGVPKREEQA